KKRGRQEPDDDLKMLDEAFDSISPSGPVTDEQDIAVEDMDASADSLASIEAAADRESLDDLGGSDADAALSALSDDRRHEESSPTTDAEGELSGVHSVAEYMARIAEMEEQLAQKTGEIERLKAGSGGGGGGGTKEVLALKASVNQK